MNIPVKCPSCVGKLFITEFSCPECRTTIRGSFELPVLAALDREEESFLKTFLAAKGNIKEVERRLGISYPTVKSRLEAILDKLGLGAVQAETKRRTLAVVERLERGEINAQEAVALLKELGE